MDAPILDIFDDDGIINQKTYAKSTEGFAEKQKILKDRRIDTCLFIFSRVMIDDIAEDMEEFYLFKNASNENWAYIYKNKFLISFAPLGGNCAGGMMEELGFLGIRKFFACGSAGQVDPSRDGSSFVLVERAIRDEGTSYHYIAPSVYAFTDEGLTKSLGEYLDREGFKYFMGTTWTTDAFFRETQKAVDKRLSQGAVCVEMECASWCAIAKFRGYKFAQLLYFSDAVKQDAWEWKLDKHALKEAVIKIMVAFLEEFC